MKPSETQQPCAKPSLSQARTALRVAGVHGNGDDARAALSLLASLKDRIDALRALLPNLARTIDFLLMAGSVALLDFLDNAQQSVRLGREKCMQVRRIEKGGIRPVCAQQALNQSHLAPYRLQLAELVIGDLVIHEITTVRLKIKQNQLVSVAIRLDW